MNIYAKAMNERTIYWNAKSVFSEAEAPSALSLMNEGGLPSVGTQFAKGSLGRKPKGKEEKHDEKKLKDRYG
ncbi:hypothetical protein M407DRAFT_246520 [Tulasnella calospora MUT 4182]|uniref:Uncharacterized protein n=1 Tax=Tulasnella calospora MUT 4182 TaxID=1051891 RepID=A0A0C3L9Y7_9AGAM|nr:hypothetical protein M407DRAFT_246520 [Tulasnella calospora MUT 4182]